MLSKATHRGHWTEQTEELEEQKGKAVQIWATETRHPAGKAEGSKVQLKVCGQE